MEGESMSEWKEVKLEEILIIYDKKRRPLSSIQRSSFQGQYRYYGAQGIIDYIADYIFDGEYMLIAEDGENLNSRTQPIAQIVNGKFWVNNHAHIVRTNDKANMYLVMLILNNLNISSYVTGAAQPKLNQDNLKRISIYLPNKNEQDIIAGILSSLDAKIETNNKLNEKLEEMAQAIFKSWFVDFEPFKDKPFHETEIGYIPQIFESSVLGDLCTFKRGKGLLSKDAIFGNVPVIAGGMKPACYHNIANTKAPVVTVSGSGANAGYTQIHNVDVWASDCSFIDSNCENLYYVYCFLSRRPKLLRHSQTGAAQPHVKPADIHRFQVVIPTKDVINEFQQIVKPLFDRIGMNKKENDRLASLRDTLLPRLMSGELIV